MKNIKYQIACYIFLAIACISCIEWNDHNINISIKEKRDYYQFNASFSKYKTAEVQYYINKSISPNDFFTSPHDHIDVFQELNDGTKFHLKSSPGKLKIRLDKRENSEASYLRIKDMCEGLKGVLAEK